MLEQEKPRRTIAERIRKKEPKPKKAKTPKKRESYRVEAEPGESRIMWPAPHAGDGPGMAGGMVQVTDKAGVDPRLLIE
ncbi:MAG: hypothetical protein ACLSAH_15820 [Bilophila wadsworthia]